MSIEKLLDDYNITYVTEGHKHSTAGWVNINCPFCKGSQDFHMGIREEMTGCHCWRCGGHSFADTLGKILSITKNEAWHVIQKYNKDILMINRGVAEPRVAINPLKYPKPNIKLNKFGKQYLQNRGFNPDYIEEQWGVLQTSPISILDGIFYGNRILIPIKWNGKTVSFQTRDMTGLHNLKYITCPMKREIIHHKNILYCNQESLEKSKIIIIVEGVFDVWKFGEHSCAIFGTSFKMEQVLQLSKYDAKFFIVFDNEYPAQVQARKLSVKLKTLGKVVYVDSVGTDPGDMSISDANHYVKNLTKKGIL